MIARAIFLNNLGINDLILTLKFDEFLIPTPDKTYILYGPNDFDFELDQVLQNHGINTDKFSILPDRSLWEPHGNEVNIYQFGGWIAQQFIKFIALDKLSYDHAILIQDCDTFNIVPYHWLIDNKPNLFKIENTSHSHEYYQYVKDFTGQSRVSPHCFVTEFMPVLKNDWIALKNYLENFYQCSWLKAMHKKFEEDTKNSSLEQIWFSEYELLGNWALMRDPCTKTMSQKRFVLNPNTMSNLGSNLKEYTSICLNGSLDINQIGIAEDKIAKVIYSN